MSREGALAPATVRIPDLSLLILETKDEGETLLSLRLTSANPALGYNLKLFGPTRLKSDPFAYFQSLFTDIQRFQSRARRQGEGRDHAGEHGSDPLRRPHAR